MEKTRTERNRILIVDDDEALLTALHMFLERRQFDVTAVTNPESAIEKIRQDEFDVVLLDLNYDRDTTSGGEGLRLLDEMLAIAVECPLIVMTGWATVDLAVAAMKKGAVDFIQKPWENDHLLRVLTTQIRLHKTERRSRLLERENQLLRKAAGGSSGLIAVSQSMRDVLERAAKLGRSDMNLLIRGENGTGKSLLARYFHEHSRRNDQPFIAVNMGGIVDSLFESEMFGHVKGAFTDAAESRIGRFELAEGGTLFLDEIANVPLAQQAKLLRVLEERRFEKVGSSKTQACDIRIVSATNSNLEEMIEEGSFRQDLLYRLNTVELEIPALRNRREDILPLAEHFLSRLVEKYGLEPPRILDDAQSALEGYRWPGNVRELSHSIERALFAGDTRTVSARDLGLEQPVGSGHSVDTPADADLPLCEIEKQVIRARLKHHQGHMQETAKSLGLSRSAFYRRLEKHGL